MKTRILIVVAVLLGLTAAEIFYFRFHTYFQQVEVSEAPRIQEPTPTSPTAELPKTVAQGSFVEVDAVHKGSGTVRVIEQNGESYVRFEDFRVTNGPDLYVYLSDTETPGNTLESLGHYTSLGLLKGNVGDQNYVIPSTRTGYRTVVIWCQEFGVLFSFATLR